MTAGKSRLLLIREFRRPTGGNVKVRDYFRHAAAHPRIDARIWFPPGSRHREYDLWSDLEPEHIAEAFRPSAFDLICVNGKDWSFLPENIGTAEIIHFVQHAGYATDPQLRTYLARPARRIFTSRTLHDLLAPLANGPSSVVPIGIDPAFFWSAGDSKTRPVTILGGKQPDFAAALGQRLAARDLDPTLLVGPWRPRAEHVAIVKSSDVLVTLPNREEGFYLPALEGMAANCLVVCSDAVGNREHCIPDETCLQPLRGDLDGHVSAVVRLLGNRAARARLRMGGAAMALRHEMSAERAAFHAMLDAALAERPAAATDRSGG